MTTRRKRFLAVGFTSILLFAGSYIAFSQAAPDLLVNLIARHNIHLKVGRSMETFSYSNDLPPLADIARGAQNVRFPVRANLAPIDRDAPLAFFLDQFSDYDSLATALLAINAAQPLYKQSDLMNIVASSGRCSPATLAALQAQYGN